MSEQKVNYVRNQAEIDRQKVSFLHRDVLAFVVPIGFRAHIENVLKVTEAENGRHRNVFAA